MTQHNSYIEFIFFIIFQILSFPPYFFNHFIRLKLPQFRWWIRCGPRSWKPCRTDFLLCGCLINRKCVTLRWWRFTWMVVIWETMRFGWLKWQTRETSWCVLFLVDSLFIKYIRKGEILQYFFLILDWQSFLVDSLCFNWYWILIFIPFVFFVGIVDFWRKINRIHNKLSRCWWWWNCG